jgi:ABC-2 type transport system permease protein
MVHEIHVIPGGIRAARSRGPRGSYQWGIYLLNQRSSRADVSGANAQGAAKKGIKKTILLHSSKYTKVLNAPVRISLGIVQQEPRPEQFNKSFKPLAVLLEGTFESVFINRIPPTISKSSEIQFKSMSKPTKMIVVSDGDVIKNAVSSAGKIYPLGFDRYTNEFYGNTNFILNSMNYLTDNSGLISIRSRELTLRLLDKELVKTDKLYWQVFNSMLPIFLIILYGIVHNYLRRKKYTN